MNPWLLLLLVVGATHRVTRLLVADKIPLVAVPRDAIINHFGQFDHRGELVAGRRWGKLGWSIAYLLACPWCMSVWVAGGVVFGVGVFVSVPLPWLWVGLASTVTGVLSGIVEAEHEQRWELADLELQRRRRD